MTVTARQPAGSPTGGQFAPTGRAEADLDLATPAPELPDFSALLALRGRARLRLRRAQREMDDATLAVLCGQIGQSSPQARTIKARLSDEGGRYLVLGVSADDEVGQRVDLRVDTEVAAIRLIGEMDVDDLTERVGTSGMSMSEDTLSIGLAGAADFLFGEHR